MRMFEPALAGFLLLSAALPAVSQPIDAYPGGYEPAPQDLPAGPPPDRSGVYAGLRGSYALNGNNQSTYTPTAMPTRLRASMAGGAGGSIYIGAYLPLNLRLELEGLYRWQRLSNVTLDGASAGPVSGHSQTAAPFLNLLWDVPVPDDYGIQPFVGMGVGAAYNDTDATGSGNTYLHRSGWNLAYSFMGGFSLPMAEGHRLSLMYRWMQMRDAKQNCAISGVTLTRCLDTNINSSAVDLGYEMDL